MRAFNNGQYLKAVEHFQAAARLDPDSLNARLYLATTYMNQWVSGAPSEENQRNAEAARKGFQDVLDRDPTNVLAVESLASLAFNQQKLDDAEKWYERLMAINPQKKEAYYTLGVIAYYRTYSPRMDARSRIGMRPEDPGPLKDEEIRKALSRTSMPVIAEGIENLAKALELDPDYDDAMAYLNLLYRAKADLEDSLDASEIDTRLADEWLKKAMETRKRRSEPRR